MKTYRVARTMITNEIVEIKADSEKEAINLAEEGEGELVGGGNFCLFEDARVLETK